MPELPEVEVVKRTLERKVLNLIIKKVKINDGNLRYRVNKSDFLKLSGKRIKKIERKSKFLIFKIGKNIMMLVHLGMTGKFFFSNTRNKKFKTSFYYKLDNSKDQKYDRIVFYLEKKQKLIYNDIRKFGFIKVIDFDKYKNNSHLKHLGPEPLEEDFNFKYFKNYISGKNRNVKNVLMDQKCISGLGNIYVNEILFCCSIRPSKKVVMLTNKEIEKIIFNTKKIIKKSIKLGGSSIKNFSSIDGKKGAFQQTFKVYGRNGENCSNTDCNTIITKLIISNRSSFYCPRCQK